MGNVLQNTSCDRPGSAFRSRLCLQLLGIIGLCAEHKTTVIKPTADSSQQHVEPFKRPPSLTAFRPHTIHNACSRSVSLILSNRLISDANSRFRVDRSVEANHEVATFAGGCFWGVEHIFLKHYPPSQNKGILKTAVGYTGGKADNTTYDAVCSGTTGHAEALRIEFDPKIMSYAELVGEYALAFSATSRA